MKLIHGPRFPSFSFVAPTPNLQQLVLKVYLRRGWKYFVTWKDVNGWGIHGAMRAEWQDANSAPHINSIS